MTRRGDTLLFDAPPTVAAWAAAGGKKESEGPLASAFDFSETDFFAYNLIFRYKIQCI